MVQYVFSWGANSYGQLGNETLDDIIKPASLDRLKCNISTVTGGGGHTVLLSEDKHVYGCGWNSKGQLGVSTLENVSSLTKVETSKIDSEPVQLACGWDFTLILFKNGKLFSCGSNWFGQLGVPNDISGKHSSELHEIVLENGTKSDQVFSEVAAGLRHAVGVTDIGNIYVWGSGKKGQLGICEQDKPLSKSDKPMKLSVPYDKPDDTILHVTCGAYHSACLTRSGKIFIWGDNKHGQITVSLSGGSSIMCPYPHCIDQQYFAHKPVSRIVSGWTHILAETVDGDIYSWGRNDYHQLGRETTDTHYDHIPNKISVLKRPKIICCGSEHNLVLSDDGNVYSWGWNEHGICGTGDEVNVSLPNPIQSFSKHNITTIGCGMGHSFVVAHEM